MRDLAKWIVNRIEQKSVGLYNVTGDPITFEKLLQECQKVCNSEATFTWISEDFLIENQVQDWVELPLWLSYKRNMPGFLNVSIEKAQQTGLTLRPLSETLKAILEQKNYQGGLNPDKESTLLNHWKNSF